jgi:hypothetical protein
MSKHKLIRRQVVGGLVIAAASFPAAAQARFALSEPAGIDPSAPAQVVGASAVHTAGAGAQSEFQWDDAGVGAAATVALLSAGAAASRVARRRRAHRVVVG